MAAAMAGVGYAQSGSSTSENIPSGSLIIPMDNVNQGNAGGTTFNLRAYGLANILLQKNIPVKWSIKDGKAKNGEDFKASFTRIAGSAGSASGTNASFSGGPFIVEAQYASLAIPEITAYNNVISGTADDVVVYQTSGALASIPVRYTLTHKPYIAIGIDGGGYGSSVNQALFERAGITSSYYKPTPDNLIGAGACFTIATQAHSTDPSFVTNYKNFVTAGGNLLLQCASIGTFENAAGGHFQSALISGSGPSYNVWGTNDSTSLSTTLTYPNPAIPFAQFIGTLANQDGAITEFSFTGVNRCGSGTATAQFINGTQVAAENSGTGNACSTNTAANVKVGTVSKVGNTGQPGGFVFALGGHDYTRGSMADIEKLNGQRMLLNTIFVPVSRPCGQQGQPSVFGYKSVKLTTDQGYPGLSPNDTITWTIDYVNTGSGPAASFTIQDPLPLDRVSFVGPAVLVGTTNATGVVLNSAFNGGSDPNLINAGAVLGVNGRITIQVKTKINNGFYGTILNQATAKATGINASGVKSDTLDNQTQGTFGGVVTPSGSICQELGVSGCTNNFQTPAIDPTGVKLFAPTSATATISGSVVDASGIGIGRTTVAITNGATGSVRLIQTNPFGYYSVSGLEVGALHTVSVSSKRHTFVEPSMSFVLNDNVGGLTFVALPDNSSAK